MARVGDAIRSRIAQIRAIPAVIAANAAPRIQQNLRTHARTKRGNVPSFGEHGNVPIVAEARPEAIVVTAPDWCLEKAQNLGQTDEWMAIVADEAMKAGQSK